MRYILMSFSVLVVLSSQELFASAKTDSIVAFLGGAQAKFVWLKWAWCNDNYKPKTQAAAKAEGWSLELLDTREGKQRTLATGCKNDQNIRISRSGKWVTLVEADATYIVDLTAASPTKKVLMSKSDCTYWMVGAWWIDQTNGDEYCYCIDNCVFPTGSAGGGTGIYKVKLKSDGTVDRTTATKLTINGLSSPGDGTPPIDISLSVSADGKKLADAFPWPNTYILDVPSGRLDMRHSGTFGCQANLAPDNSYRFFHCEDNHRSVYMFDANMSTTNWLVNLRLNLAGYTGPTTGDETGPEFWAPRWTNHVQYQACTRPLNGYITTGWNNSMDVDADFYAADGGSLWSKDSTWVKTKIDMDQVNQGYLGKFSSDFKTQEKTIAIACDPRYFQILIDGWICNGTTYGSQCGPIVSASPAIRGNRLTGLSVVQSGAFVNVHADAAATVRITDARGRLVRQLTESGSIAVDTRDLAVGAYIISAYQQGNRLTKQVMIAR